MPRDALTMEGNGQSFTVDLVGPAKTQFKELCREAATAERRQHLFDAMLQIISRLEKDPFNSGEPTYRLSTLNLQLRTIVVAPLVVHYGVHDDEPLVLIRAVQALP